MKTLLFTLFPFLITAQNSISGSIIDYETKLPISYVTVGLIKENTGKNTDESGFFEMIVNEKIKNDTLIFTCLGYETQKIVIDKSIDKQQLNIAMKVKLTDLETVTVSKKIWTTKTLNEFSSCNHSGLTTTGYMTQSAQHIKVEEPNSILEDVRICRSNFVLFSPDKTIFRLRVYDMDSLTKKPSKDLCNEIIEIKTKKKIVEIDLKKYNIHIPNKDFFVAIEWLKIPYNETKGKTNMNGIEKEYSRFSPSITFNDKSKLEFWMLNYKNEWVKGFFDKSLSIEATVKY